jgi:hypothetical protein
MNELKDKFGPEDNARMLLDSRSGVIGYLEFKSEEWSSLWTEDGHEHEVQPAHIQEIVVRGSIWFHSGSMTKTVRFTDGRYVPTIVSNQTSRSGN